MTRWALLRQAALPLLPWLLLGLVAVFGAGAASGAWVASEMAQGRVERLKRQSAEDEAARNALVAVTTLAHQATNYFLSMGDRQAVAGLRARLDAAEFRAAKLEGELKDALARTGLGDVDARGPARVLRKQAEEFRARVDAVKTARAGRADADTARPAGNGGQGARDGRDDDSP